MYYLKLKDIDQEIKVEREINTDSESEFTKINARIDSLEKDLSSENEKIEPIKNKNFEILSKIQRLNIELKSIDEENKRIQEEIENLKSNLSVINEDQDKEKSIIVDANSNEKRLKEEKNELIEIDARYYDTEKSSNEDLDASKKILNNQIENIKVFIADGNKDEALSHLDKCKEYIESYAINFSKNQNIKNESIKRKERINVIDTEIFSWKNLLSKSQKS